VHVEPEDRQLRLPSAGGVCFPHGIENIKKRKDKKVQCGGSN
jgi:hypothetical protein